MKSVDEISSIKPAQLEGIRRMFSSFGTGPDGRRRAAKTFHLTESAFESLATALTEKPKAPAKPVTESAPEVHGSAATLGDTSPRGQYLAARLAKQVNAAEARIEADGGSMANLTTQHLEALAAARFGG